MDRWFLNSGPRGEGGLFGTEGIGKETLSDQESTLLWLLPRTGIKWPPAKLRLYGSSEVGFVSSSACSRMGERGADYLTHRCSLPIWEVSPWKINTRMKSLRGGCVQESEPTSLM